MQSVHFRRHIQSGFTLVELLVVIAIIITLAGITMAVVNGVMERSKETTAKKDCTELVQAIENYILDTGRLPVTWNAKTIDKKTDKRGQIYVTTALDDDSQLMSILTNYLPKGRDAERWNPKKTAYFNTTQTNIENASGLYFESPGRVGLMDPWESPYYIVMSANPDDRSPRVHVGKKMITKNVAVYSTGKDKQGSTVDRHIDNPEWTDDNVASFNN